MNAASTLLYGADDVGEAGVVFTVGMPKTRRKLRI